MYATIKYGVTLGSKFVDAGGPRGGLTVCSTHHGVNKRLSEDARMGPPQSDLHLGYMRSNNSLTCLSLYEEYFESEKTITSLNIFAVARCKNIENMLTSSCGRAATPPC